MEGDNTNTESSKKPKSKLWLTIGIICTIVLIYYVYITFIESPKEIVPIIENITFQQVVCSQIIVPLTWADVYGIRGEGYTDFNGLNPMDIVSQLIKDQIYFIYNSNEEDYKDQIGYFGSEWGKYVNSGFTIDCKNV